MRAFWSLSKSKPAGTRVLEIPKWAVTPAKQRRISMVALAYLKKHHSVDTPSRFDVVTVRQTRQAPVIELVTNAFELAYAG